MKHHCQICSIFDFGSTGIMPIHKKRVFIDSEDCDMYRVIHCAYAGIF